jgi:hypothetical protein
MFLFTDSSRGEDFVNMMRKIYQFDQAVPAMTPSSISNQVDTKLLRRLSKVNINPVRRLSLMPKRFGLPDGLNQP